MTPSIHMKFLCDSMLAHIGRRLRMAGYDTVIAKGGESDHELVLRAREENRTLLSGDRQMRERKAAKSVLVFLPGNEEESWVRHLSQVLGVDWLHAPFTRCLECNLILESPPSEKISELPEPIKQQGFSFRYCPGCDKIFWEGGHVQRMRERLQKLQNG